MDKFQTSFFPLIKALPPTGITVFGGLPHTHRLGRSVRLRHLRGGAEMEVPFQDRFYDPNYQTMRRYNRNFISIFVLSCEMKVLEEKCA